MKILQVIPYFCFGGAETMCENLTYGLRDLGHEVMVVSLYAERTPISQRMEEAGVTIHYLDKKLGLDLSMVGKLRKIMKQFRPDVVHTHLDVIKYAVAAARLCGGIPCIHTVHNVADKEAEGRLQKIINGAYFRLGWSTPVALSPLVKDSIVDFYGLPREKVPMVYNGVDLSRCISKESYSDRPGKLLHIGRFNAQKNHECLLRGFALLLEKHPSCTLTLLGDGELRQDMESLAKDLGIAGKTVFLGSQSNVYPYLNEADIFLLPSRYEGMPMTVIEAMGTGLPVVAANVGGLGDMLNHGKSGMLLPSPVSPESLSQSIAELLENPGLCQTLGSNAREESQKFSAQTMAEEYCGFYQK